MGGKSELLSFLWNSFSVFPALFQASLSSYFPKVRWMHSFIKCVPRTFLFPTTLTNETGKILVLRSG